jgi:hypothetical protein
VLRLLTRALLAACAVSLAAPRTTAAQAVQVAPFAGLTFASSSGAGSRPGAFGGTVDVRAAEPWKIELMYSRQPGAEPGHRGEAGATLERLMAGLVEERGEGRSRFFGVALLGATRLSADDGLGGADTFFTLGLGLGVKHLVQEHFGFRAEARGFYALTESAGAAACNGGCVFGFGGNGLFHGDVTVGVVLSF